MKKENTFKEKCDDCGEIVWTGEIYVLVEKKVCGSCIDKYL